MAGGKSVAALRAQLQGPKKEAQAAAAQKPQRRVHIERKQWDPSQLINAHAASARSPGTAPPAPKEPTPLELAADVAAGADGATVMSRQVIPVDGGAVLVLVTESGGEVTVRVASDLREPLALHWAVSRQGHEWSQPPAGVVPAGSAEAGGSVETPLQRGWGGQDSVQGAQVALGPDAGGLVALPFVLHAAAGWWLKNGGKDFVAPLKKAPPPPPAPDVDSSKMVKWLVDEIADSEREAEKSFMHRCGCPRPCRRCTGRGRNSALRWLQSATSVELSPCGLARHCSSPQSGSEAWLAPSGQHAPPLLDRTGPPPPNERLCVLAFAHSSPSPPCRFNLAAGFAEKARDAGTLGLAAVFVWLRYCQTRQLNWNVNYNVKPRCGPPAWTPGLRHGSAGWSVPSPGQAAARELFPAASRAPERPSLAPPCGAGPCPRIHVRCTSARPCGAAPSDGDLVGGAGRSAPRRTD